MMLSRTSRLLLRTLTRATAQPQVQPQAQTQVQTRHVLWEAGPLARGVGARCMLSTQGESPPGKGIATQNAKTARLQLVFTCGKCETRAVKSFTKNAYENGVVIVTCPKCDARHLIADNLGWFGDERNIEQVLAQKGQTVTKITDKDIEYTPPDDIPPPQ